MLLFHLVNALGSTPHAVASNVVVVVADGLRREEVFGGAQDDLLPSVDGTVAARFGAGDGVARRQALMPFFWQTIGVRGQILGDQSVGSICEVTNPYWFSYPGYSEMLCGFADKRINKNDPTPNPNVTVYEWLNHRTNLHGKVAAFGAWGVISSVFNKQRCEFPAVAGYEPIDAGVQNAEIVAANRAKTEGNHVWANEAPDDVAFQSTLAYIRAKQPRVLFLSLGETDKWAHEGKYDHYLQAACNFDADVEKLWKTLQALPQYHNKTTLILTCDHGRGEGKDWTSHGKKLPNSRYTWIAVMGPGTSARGVIPNVHATNSQIAATAAAALGYDYCFAQGKAAPALDSALR